jgi:hypothetical protein
MLTGLLLCVFSALPVGSAPAALEMPWFPDRLHAFVWTNWGLVPVERMAEVTGGSVEDLAQVAARMALGAPLPVSDDQWRRSYITIIRRNWHLLPYDQLLKLLGWTEEEMAYTLREDDFLYIKLGSLKPQCEPLRYAAPTPEVVARATQIGERIRKAFPEGPLALKEPLFDFVRDLSQPVSAAPPLPEGGMSPRYCYSYFALYGDPLMDPKADPFPDGFLSRLAAMGVNGVWLQGVLFKLAPFPWDTTHSEHHEQRLENLRILVERAAKHGIKVYLYLNEPRSMPVAFFEERPEVRGVTIGDYAMLCTNAPPVREYLSSSVAGILKAVPDLGGFFTISASENPTSCWSHGQGGNCPRCAPVGAAATIAGVQAAIQDGIDRAGSKATLFAWDWGWADDWAPAAIEALPKAVSLMSVSEWSIPIVRGGIESVVGEYSLSAIGPGPRASRHWAIAKEHGHGTMAKLQVGCTWELGAVPYIPAVANVAEHLSRLGKAGVNGAMLGWTLGGYPSPNMEVASAIAAQPDLSPDDAMMQVATRRFGAEDAALVVAAWKGMSTAFQEFPYNIGVVYNAPLQAGPSNSLWPAHTGYAATMVGIPYDDLDSWRNLFPVEVFAGQLEKVAAGFEEALEPLHARLEVGAGLPELVREVDVATACALHFMSVAQQSRFVYLRNALLAVTSRADAEGLLAVLDSNILAERRRAIELHAIQCRDSRIGFEATNHYFYTPNDLAAKVLNCDYLTNEWLPAQRTRVAQLP